MPNKVVKKSVFGPEAKKGKGQILDEIVKFIIDGGKEAIDEYRARSDDDERWLWEHHIFTLPIKIDGIPVLMRLGIRIDRISEAQMVLRNLTPPENYYFGLKAELEYNGSVCGEDGEDDTLYYEKLLCKVENDIIDKNDITKNILHLFDDINNLKYCKLKHRFISKEDVLQNNIIYKTINYFELEDNRGDDCCICYDKTILKTQCGHPICLPCVTKLKVYEEEFEEFPSLYFDCPLCKQVVYYTTDHYFEKKD